MNERKQINIRERIAITVTMVTISGSIALGVIGVIFAFNSDKNQTENLQYVFGVLLPLWGTWVGTILAYYFSKENFETASKNTQQILDKVISAQDKLKSIQAWDVMIPFKEMVIHMLGKKESLEKLKLEEIRKKLINRDKMRLPILNSDRQLKAVIHKSTIDHFIADQCFKDNITEKDFDKMDVEQAMKKDKYFEKVITSSHGFISKDSSLLEAQKEMERIELCNDIFITETGSKDEPVLGWVTNIRIAEKVQLK